MQCEIIQQHMLEVLPTDEEPIPPHDDDGGPPMFDFFWFRQPGPGPFNPPAIHLHGNVVEDDEDQEEWDNWMPQELDAAPTAKQPNDP
jgi:hypothetical protein